LDIVLPNPESNSNSASNAAGQKNKRAFWTYCGTTPQPYQRLKHYTWQVFGVEAAILGVLALSNSQSCILTKEPDYKANEYACTSQ
jgi:hypothetical protein